ncbi:MAG TPA: hypothetical protein DCX32_01910 [Candidatus Moranbacteria bacterium]|nr:MAG: hypothetical protein UW87_C0009G0011 [Candidatus Moranbacteria bacterium GW2011_GWC2_45_10]KKT95091.1 MAG: hypothetical protein UW95_C0004G0009 [Parcubacteria group bacterium GW2011_GWC1_45_14]HAV11277.1 hypothetical protein [Candidatus Moranbacteria bacterium]
MIERRPIEISTGIVVRTIFIVLALWLLYFVRDILALFFISVILTATLDPLVDWMKKKKIPRPLGTFMIYIAAIALIGTAISFLIPPLVGQFQDFNEKIPQYAERTNQLFLGIESYAASHGLQFNAESFIRDMFSNAFQSSEQLFSRTVGVVNFFVSVIVVLSLTFYMLVKEEGMKRFIMTITPRDHQEYVLSFFDRIHNKIGRWVFGQFILMLAVFAMSFAVLSAFNVPFALLIALVAGLLEVIPYIGPIISATIATLLGFLISPVVGLIVLGSFIIIQQIENHILVPQIMKKAVGLNPVAVILVLLIGAKLGGVMGTILAIPLATAVGIFIGDIIDKKETQE